MNETITKNDQQEPEPEQPGPVVIDGPMLRSVRMGLGVALRRISIAARMSHGHLSKVERGEYGRPVTPAIINAYERLLGVNLAEIAAAGEIPQAPGKPKPLKEWRSGQMTVFQRRWLMGQIAVTAAGADAGAAAGLGKLLGESGAATPPEFDNPATLAVLERLVEVLDQLDEPAGAAARQLLSWAIRLTTQLVDTTNLAVRAPLFPPETVARVYAVVAGLARRAARGAQAARREESARMLYLLALSAAATAGDPDLRATVLAELANQHVSVGYPDDALGVLRMAEGDERVSEDTRGRLKSVRVQAEHAGRGN